MGGSPSRVAADASLHAVTPDAAPARPPLRNLADASPLSSASAPNLLKMPPRQNPRTSSQRRSLNARSKSFAGAKLEQVVKSVMRGSFAGTAESTTPLLLSQLYSTDKKGRARRRSRTASHGSPSATPRIRIRSRGVLPSLAGVGKHTAAEAKYPMWLIPVPGKKLLAVSSVCCGRPSVLQLQRTAQRISCVCPGPFCNPEETITATYIFTSVVRGLVDTIVTLCAGRPPAPTPRCFYKGCPVATILGRMFVAELSVRPPA